MTEKDMEQAEQIVEEIKEEGTAPHVESDGEGAEPDIKQSLEEEKNRYMRLCADFENYKKRTAREKQDFRKFANESLIKEILPVVDNLERAIQSADTGENAAAKSILDGVEMTQKEILKILDRFNVKAVKSVGEPFNPEFHQAVAQESSEEHGDNIVIREFQKGYLLHDRLIRPAMVVVSKAANPPSETETENIDDTAEKTDENKGTAAEENAAQNEDSEDADA